jgi:hypothetical protein
VSISFPPDLRPIVQYPGYFWDITALTLYTIKGGYLRPLTPTTKKNRFNDQIWNYCGGPYYSISHQGRRKYLGVDRLKMNTYPDPYQLPVT